MPGRGIGTAGIEGCIDVLGRGLTADISHHLNNYYYFFFFLPICSFHQLQIPQKLYSTGHCKLLETPRVRFFGRIRKRICDPRSYGFFETKETQNPKKDYFVMTRQAGGTQFIYQNDISLVLP